MNSVVLLLFVGVSHVMALSVTSCETCSAGDGLLKFEIIGGYKKLSMKHTFLTQVFTPDDLGKVTSVIYKLEYEVLPPHYTTWHTIENRKTGKTELAGTKRVIRLFLWADVLDGKLNVMSTNEIHNGTYKNIHTIGAECVEFRYFGFLPERHKVHVKYTGEVWWMGKK
jgi:hypothetical protein